MMKTLLRVSVFLTFLLGIGVSISTAKTVKAADDFQNIWMNNNISWPESETIITSEPTDPDLNPAFKPLNGLFDLVGNARAITDTTYTTGFQLTNSTKTSGMIRSAETNKINLDIPFTLESYVYIADKSTEKPADGISFFMTTDQPTIGSRTGEALGVWGTSTYSAQNMSTSAMPKSFAIVLDHYTKSDPSIDDQNLGDYIAHGYPGLQSTYERCNTTLHGRHYRLNLGGTVPYKDKLNLVTGGWRSLTIVYEPTADEGGKLTYSYNRAEIGSVTWSAKFIQDTFGSRSLYWGFAATTGDTNRLTHHAVAIKSLTNTIDAKAAVSAVQGSNSIDSNSAVRVGDTITQKFDVTYSKDSRQSWSISSGLQIELKTGNNYRFKPYAKDIYHINVNGTNRLAKLSEGNDTGRAITVTVEDLNAIPIARPPTGLDSREDTEWHISAEVEVVSNTHEEANAVCTMTGDSGTIQKALLLPKPIIDEFELVEVPSLHFNSITLAQLFKGTVTTLPNGTIPKVIVRNTFPNSETKLTASLITSFNLSDSYVPGSAHISFDIDGTSKSLPDDETEVTLIENMGNSAQDMSRDLTNVKLHLPSVMDGKADYFQTTINWTIVKAP